MMLEDANERSVRSFGPLSSAVARVRQLGILFWVCVVIPSSLAILYFGFLASDIYISESRYVVRSPERTTTTGLGGLLQSTGIGGGGEEVRAAQGYIESRDALRSLETSGLPRKAWANDSIFILNRFDPWGVADSFEDLFLYYEDMVGVTYDSESGISTLSVRAFNPADAEAMNRELLRDAEELVNKLNERGQEDLVRYAQVEVDEAKKEARDAALALAGYRNSAGVVDPERQASVQLQMVSKLQDELIGARLQLRQLQALAPQNPQIPVLRNRIDGLQSAIAREMETIAGSGRSLSAAAAEFQRLELEREYADKQLAASLAALQEARNEARRQSAYVERVSQPSMPDAAMEPRRFRGILTTVLLGLIAWGVLTMLLAGVREHRD